MTSNQFKTLAASLAILLIQFGVAIGQQGKVAEKRKPIRALLVTGGCCHDYDQQKLILTKGISARADVVWTVVQQGGKTTNTKIPLYKDKGWADGFDVVVHNECFAAVSDKDWVDRILEPHRKGIPAVLIHCAMHSYRTGDDRWFEFVGVQSPRHGAHYAYTVENLRYDHPIMRGFGPSWETPKGELYHTVRLFKTAQPLAHAKRKPDNQAQVCVWTNQYGKARVFGTTIGHYNEAMADSKYLDMVTRGLLWSVNRLDEKTVWKASKAATAEIESLIKKKPAVSVTSNSKCCQKGNLALGRAVHASSEEKNKSNFARRAVDGDLSTRWCAVGSSPSHWQVELEKPSKLRSIRIYWEKPDAAYRYRLEVSSDGKDWTTVADRSKNRRKAQITTDKVDVDKAKFVRVQFIGADRGYWGSFWELVASSDTLPELKPNAKLGQPSSAMNIKAPDGFRVSLYGTPPQVNYPVCLAAAPTGEVFVGVDPQGSLGKQPNQGKVVRCVDTDGDGQADEIKTFAKVDHPRGLVYDNGSLWVLHPPQLTVFHDDDLDGVADRRQTLITGISSSEVNRRGADHTTNGIRMGIDGWIYIAVGDFGFTQAKGADGRILSRRGGGIVRVRPDGTDMEYYCWGLRNIVDVAVDPLLNVFTRDNTNDGGGWDIRVSHILQSAEYGYPSLYKNFSGEIMPPLADYGGGSGCGAMFFQDERWPAPYGNALYTCDWGRSEVFVHNLKTTGPTFAPHQASFLKLERPTDIDVDGSGRMYVSSWRNGKFSFSGPNVGYVAQVTPVDFVPKPFPELNRMTDDDVITVLKSTSAVHRLHAQREILRRPGRVLVPQQLGAIAADKNQTLASRIAAIFTLKQYDGELSTGKLLSLAEDDSVREFALRALTDRTGEASRLPLEPFLKALKDPDARIQAQAVISLGRMGKVAAAKAIVPLTMRAKGSKAPTAKPAWNQADPGRVIPHLAVRALDALNASEATLEAIGSEHSQGALRALKYLHDPQAVDGLLYRLSTIRKPSLRREVLTTLIRLYHREGEYKGGWWGTRPDTSGPYYDRKKWSQSDRIAAAIKTAASEADKETRQHIVQQLARHKVEIAGFESVAKAESVVKQKPIMLPKVDPNNKNQIANIDYERVVSRTLSLKGSAERGQKLFVRQSCVACHTFANGQNPKGPHLVDIGKRYKPAELIESIIKPSAKIAQGFDTYGFILESGKTVTGFVVSESAESVIVREANGVSRTIPQNEIDERVKQKQSMMPKGIADTMTVQELADLLKYLQSLH